MGPKDSAETMFGTFFAFLIDDESAYDLFLKSPADDSETIDPSRTPLEDKKRPLLTKFEERKRSLMPKSIAKIYATLHTNPQLGGRPHDPEAAARFEQ